VTRLDALYSHLEDLWKARKPKSADQILETVKDMESSLGPWGEEHGSRAEAVAHYLEHGRMNAVKLHKDAPVGTPQAKAAKLASDLRGWARVGKIKKLDATGDTLQDLDDEHLKAHSSSWANHHDLMDNASPGSMEIEKRTGTTFGNRPVQLRSNLVNQRIKYMQAQGHREPFASLEDLKTLNVGVERAVNAGRLTTGQANRFRVMNAAVGILHRSHKDSGSTLPFQPSYAAMDTGALEAMKVGAEHLDEMGFPEHKARLAPLLSSAVESHAKHGFIPYDRARRDRSIAVAYPNLHPIGSPEHLRQKDVYGGIQNQATRRRGAPAKQSPVAAPVVPAAPAAPVEIPKSHEEYMATLAPGQKPDPIMTTKIERNMRALKSAKIEKAFNTAVLFKSWQSWRAAS
jgi:hypothetical protein